MGCRIGGAKSKETRYSMSNEDAYLQMYIGLL